LPAERSEVVSDSATYLYAVTRPLDGGRLTELRGIGGSPVRCVPAGDVVGIASTVDLDEFGAETLPRHLEDLAWLERVAREHDAVVQALAEFTTAVPLRLGAVYDDDDSAASRVRQLRTAALATLDVLDGREEWGIKVYAVPPARDDRASPAERAASGLDYLRRRRGELERKAVDTRALAEDADAVFEELRARAVLARRHRPQDPVLSGARHPMLLNAAFLVGREARPQFQGAVDSVASARPSGAVVLTGPWPPYSFATLGDDP
jgi:hypothetical protein